MADIYIGNVKGPTGATGATGAQGPQGDAATISVGTVSTTAYGNTAQVTNTGTSSAAVFDFVIPQGRPGEETTTMSSLTLDTVTAQSAEYPIPATGESGAVVFGKIIKFFNDIKTAVNSKINISDIVNNLTSTATNKPLSAAQGKALNDALGTKANVATASLTPVVNSNVTAGRANFIRFGNFIAYSLAFTTSQTLPSGTNFFSLPSGYTAAATQDIPIITKDGHVATLYATGRNLAANGSVPAGAYFANGVIVVS